MWSGRKRILAVNTHVAPGIATRLIADRNSVVIVAVTVDYENTRAAVDGVHFPAQRDIVCAENSALEGEFEGRIG